MRIHQMPDCVGKRFTQLPFATPHQNSVLQRILGHLTKFIRFSLSTLIFSVQAMTLPEVSCQRTGVHDLVEFTLPNVGPASAKFDAGIPSCPR